MAMHRGGTPSVEDWRSMSSGLNYRPSTTRNRHPVGGYEAVHYNDPSSNSMVPRFHGQPLDEGAVPYDPWRFFDERSRTEPYGLTSFPYHPRPSIRILVVSDGGVVQRINSNLPRFVPADESPQRGVMGQHHHRYTDQSAPPAAGSPSNGDDSLKKVMGMMRKQIFSPTYPRKKAWKRGLFSRRESSSTHIANSKEEDVDEDAGTECAICLEAFEANEQVLATPCNHMFHHECLVPWVKSNGKCPVCRFVFYERREPVAAPNATNSNNRRNVSSQIVEADILALITAMETGV
ncbi:hypothetical protein H6P81_014320 [Aristolochia fimbriata]|uniref:RING-type domain-containing protein n=1 Tax=Aristolochia fimbriata TaxID=158543 RepID=A0AAV7EH81_ARIFI|nr:hypothetical protein H6P81_014320 [Aristolochia fimbriata]